MSVFDTLREEVPIDRLVEPGRNGKAHCVAPGHADNNPSMQVYEDHVHCFSCEYHGDVVDVWAAQHGFDRAIEAALELAQEFGVKLPEQSPEAKEETRERRKTEDLRLKQAQACYRALERHKRVREWWEDRGLGQEMQQRFLLGTNREGTAAVVPFWRRGRVQGLIRRNLEGEPKYVYPKAHDFPGGYRPLFVPGPVRAGAVLVEGIVDALAAVAIGESAAAVGGTGMSSELDRQLERFPAPIYIFPDNDEEGKKAARVWVQKMYPKGLLCTPEYGDGLKDLADLYREHGDEAREVLHDLQRIAKLLTHATLHVYANSQVIRSDEVTCSAYACGSTTLKTAVKSRAVDGLDLALGEAPKGSARAKYHYAREEILPLLSRLEGGEQDAALQDAAANLKLKASSLRRALSALSNLEETPEPKEDGPTVSKIEVPQDEIDGLVGRPGVLPRFVEDAARVHGVVGERSHLKLVALVAVGAQLSPLPNGRPPGANLVLTAEPGRGKNYILDAVSALLPEEFYVSFESASAKSLYYRAERNPAVVQHRFIYPNEAEATDQLVEMFRPLISGGRASHMTVNKDSDGRNAAQEFRVEGPVTLVIATVRNKLDTQLQTRMLVSGLPDYEGRVAAHSRAFSRLLLPGYAGEDHTPRMRAWHASLRTLADRRRVVFPLSHAGFCFDSDTVSHGSRLWGNLLGLMLAHAWLEQRNRETVELPGDELAVIATPEDYEAAYQVFEAACERSVVNLSDTHRAILDAVYELSREPGLSEGYSYRKIAEKAGIHFSTVGEHRTFLTKSVKLLRETESGMLTLVADAEPSWWSGEGLLEGFPRPEQVWRWWEERRSGEAPETARQPQHSAVEKSNPDTYGENDVGQSIRHPADTARQQGVSGADTAVSDEDTDSEKSIGKPNANSRGPVSSVSGGFEESGKEEEVHVL